MKHRAAAEDIEFQRAFEACDTLAEAFDHAAHLRLAYVYLCAHPLEDAAERMKASLLNYLAHLGIGAAKYHETLTRAWIEALDHFMANSAPCSSASAFLMRNRALLDSKIMLTHYSAERLFSADARQSFVPPDIEAIPPHEASGTPP
jgi:hypothetical protein